jgi:hypothetical protein
VDTDEEILYKMKLNSFLEDHFPSHVLEQVKIKKKSAKAPAVHKNQPTLDDKVVKTDPKTLEEVL